MPLPTPTENEPQDEFITRCMADETALEDFPETEQRAAVCHRQWDEAGKALSLEEQQTRIWDAWRAQFPSPAPEIVETRSAYIAEMFDDYIIIESNGEHWKVPYAEDGDAVIFAPRDEWQKVKQERNWVDAKNALKSISRTDDELRVGNYIVLFGGRDLEGIKPGTTEIAWRNADGSRGEYFTKATDLESGYTKIGRFALDMEHGKAQQMYGKGAPGRNDILGYVDWSTKKVDDNGVWVERALDMHNWYMQWISTLIDAGVVGTSSEAIPEEVQKAASGEITRWPIERDTLTIIPMEWRNKGDNVVQAFKALGIPVPEPAPADTGATEQSTTDNAPPEATPGPEHETSPEAGTPAVDVAKARARLQRFKNSILEV